MRACLTTKCVSGQSDQPIRAGNPVRSVLLAITCLLGAPELAWAGYSIEISVDGGAPTLFLDNGPDDLNPVLFDLEIPFTVGDVGNNWSATGTVLASGGNGAPPVSTIVTDTLIENIGGLFLQGEIEVVHNYAASGAGTHTATLDGQFENVLGNDIGYAELRLFAAVNSQSMGMLQEGPVINSPSPQAFVGGMLALELPTTTEHIFTFQFYLGDPGDAIRLFNSAELHTFVPEPSSAVLGLLGAGMLGVLGCKRARMQRGKRSNAAH
ncbi:MAG: PEP-CTERM sorting domain-containing protein [Pirellulales bacterium]